MPRQLFTAAALLFSASVVVVAVLATARTTSSPQRTTVAAILSTDSSDGPVSLTGYLQRSSRHYEGYSQWRFTLENDGKALAVRYKGVVPSTFEEGAHVMVVGTMRERAFVATWLGVATS